MRAKLGFLPALLLNLALTIGTVGICGNMSRADPGDPLDPIELSLEPIYSTMNCTAVKAGIFYSCPGAACPDESGNICRTFKRYDGVTGAYLGKFCDC